MSNIEQKSLLQRFEEAAAKPVPYEGLASSPIEAGLPMKNDNLTAFERYDAKKEEAELVLSWAD